MTVTEDFRTELKTILKGTLKNWLPEEECFKNIEYEYKILSFKKDILDSYNRALRILRQKSINVGKILSDTQIENIFDDFLIDFQYNNPQAKIKQIDKHIGELFKKLQSIPLEKYLFFIPINHLELEKTVQIGKNELFVFKSKTYLKHIDKTYSADISKYFGKGKRNIRELNKKNETQTYALVSVDACDEVKAMEFAIQNTEECLNVLRLFFTERPFVIRDEKREPLTRTIYFGNISKDSFTESHAGVNLDVILNKTKIDIKTHETMSKNGLDVINRILLKDKDDLTQLQEDIMTAIFWFGSAMKERDRSMKFVKSVVALEGLLIPEGGMAKQFKLSAKFTSIIYKDSPDEVKNNVFQLIKLLYSTRNSILHSGEGYVKEEDLNQVILWTRVLIQTLLRHSEKYSNLSELMKTEFPIDEKLYRVNRIADFLYSLSARFSGLAQRFSH